MTIDFYLFIIIEKYCITPTEVSYKTTISVVRIFFSAYHEIIY